MSPVLLTRPPVAEQEGEIGSADRAVLMEVGGALNLRRTRTPTAEQLGQIRHTYSVITVEVTFARQIV